MIDFFFAFTLSSHNFLLFPFLTFPLYLSLFFSCFVFVLHFYSLSFFYPLLLTLHIFFLPPFLRSLSLLLYLFLSASFLLFHYFVIPNYRSLFLNFSLFSSISPPSTFVSPFVFSSSPPHHFSPFFFLSLFSPFRFLSLPLIPPSLINLHLFLHLFLHPL